MHLEKDVAERGPPPQHVDIVLVLLDAVEADDRVDELYIWQVALGLEYVEKRLVLVSEGLHLIDAVRIATSRHIVRRSEQY